MSSQKQSVITNNALLLKACLEVDLLPLEAFVAGTKKVRVSCLKTGRQSRTSLEVLRKGTYGHRCCRDLEMLTRPDWNHRPAVEADIERSVVFCESCGSTGHTSPDDQQLDLCPQCSPGSINWTKGGVLQFWYADSELVFFATPSKHLSPALGSFASPYWGVLSLPLPRRAADSFLEALESRVLQAGGSRAHWYLAWTNEPHQAWIMPATVGQLFSEIETTLDALSQDSSYIVSRTRAELPTRKPVQATLSLGDEVTTEDLPKKKVYYPKKGGFLFGFQGDNEEDIFVCSCATGIIHLETRFNTEIQKQMLQNELIVPKLADEICHACQKQIPLLASSNYEHGDIVFRRLHWYFKQELFKMDLSYPKLEAFTNLVSPEVANYLPTVSPAEDLGLYKKQKERLRRYVKSRVKTRFSLDHLGGSSQTEVLLYNLVCEVCQDEEVIRNFRPEWLGGLELDIWLPNLKLGIEYQGEQHYVAVEQWGGQAALDDLKTRDALKRKICEANGVKLIEVPFWQSITQDFVRSLFTND